RHVSVHDADQLPRYSEHGQSGESGKNAHPPDLARLMKDREKHMLRRQGPQRRGITMVESAIVLTTMLALLIGLIVGALGIFRYQQVAACAREGARYASVHGAQYQKETGRAAATAADIYNNAILPMALGLDASQLNYTVTWNTSNAPTR